MWGAYVGVYQLLNWKMHSETLIIEIRFWDFVVAKLSLFLSSRHFQRRRKIVSTRWNLLLLENVKVNFESLSSMPLITSVAQFRVYNLKILQKYLSLFIPFFLRNEFRCWLAICLCTWTQSAMYVYIISCQFIQN